MSIHGHYTSLEKTKDFFNNDLAEIERTNDFRPIH